MPFSPFEKSVHETLTATDLQQLISRGVREGYYVEYKTTFPNNRKISHSIASLANTYGGWYFVGVATDAHNTANDICGFSLSDFPDPISKITEVIKSNMDPVAAFYPQLIHLASDRAVLAVYVPDDQETPFVTLDGRVYRRVNDSSDPVSEANRATLDQLYERGRERRARFAEFCRDNRTFSRAQEDQGWLHLYLSPYACVPLNRWKIATSEGIQELLNLSQETATIMKFGEDHVRGGLPLKFAQTTHRSVILRQFPLQETNFTSLAVELFRDGSAKLHIPIDKLCYTKHEELLQFRSKSLRSTMTGLIHSTKSGFRSIQWIDAGFLCLTVASFLAFYAAWIGEEKEHMELKMAIHGTGIWRCIPFFDADEWVVGVRKFGLPTLEIEEIKVPSASGHNISCKFEHNTVLMEVLRLLGSALGTPVDILSAAFWAVLERNATQN